MDGEVMALQHAPRVYRFSRLRPLPTVTERMEQDINKTAPQWTEDYEFDGYIGDATFYRHTKVATTIRRYYV